MRALVIALCALSLPAMAGELSTTLDISPTLRSTASESPYAVPAVLEGRRMLREELGLRWREGGLNAQGSLRMTAVEGRALDHAGEIQQLYYDGDFGAGHAYTVGKKVMAWGVGFGFRPLDVVQREDRRGVNPLPLVGIPMLAYEYFKGNDAVSVVWQRPGSGQGAGLAPVGDEALALHWYRLAGTTDLHAVARWSSRLGLEAGAGLGGTIGEEWSFHGAALVQQRYRFTQNSLAFATGMPLASTNPMADGERSAALKAIAGAQWTGESGLGVLMEAWYDGEAWSRADWQRLGAVTARQQALAGRAPQAAIDGNLAWSASAFARPNLMRENLLLRLSFDQEQRWKHSVDMLYTPRDGGRAVTLGTAWEGDRHRVSLGLRWLGGPADAALALAPIRRSAWLDWRITLP